MQLATVTPESLPLAIVDAITRHPFADRPLPQVPGLDTQAPSAIGCVDEPLVVLPPAIMACPAYVGTDGLYGDYPPRMRLGAAVRLADAQTKLPGDLRLVVLDAWRPLRFQDQLIAHFGEDAARGGYVSVTSDPRRVPPHVTGGAVDLTLDAGQGPMALGSGFDDFSDRGTLSALEKTPASFHGKLRRILFWSMMEAGFAPYQLEWWHFSYGDQNWAKYYAKTASLYPASSGHTDRTKPVYLDKVSAYKEFLAACDRQERAWTDASRGAGGEQWRPLTAQTSAGPSPLEALSTVELLGSADSIKSARRLLDWFPMAGITLEEEGKRRSPHQEAFSSDRAYYHDLRAEFIQAARRDVGLEPASGAEHPAWNEA